MGNYWTVLPSARQTSLSDELALPDGFHKVGLCL